MSKSKHFRCLALLAIVAALSSAAFICGQGRSATPTPTAMPNYDASPTPTAMPVYDESPTPPPGQEPPAGEEPPAVEPPAAEPPPDALPKGATGAVDLVITSATVQSMSVPSEAGITIYAGKKGPGLVTSSFTVRWYPHGKSDEVGCSWDIPADMVNQGDQVVGCTYPYKGHGEMHWRAIMDADDDVEETKEGNNTVNGTLTIPKPSGETTLYLAAPIYCTWNLSSIPKNIEIGWDYSGSDIDGFRIYQGVTSLELELGPGARGAIIQNLELSTQYHFDVRAFKGNTESAPDACSVDATTGQ